jgi:hypothetical protein
MKSDNKKAWKKPELKKLSGKKTEAGIKGPFTKESGSYYPTLS